MVGHDWSGNVRELKNAAERFVLSSRPPQDRLTHIFKTKCDPVPAKSTLAEQIKAYEKRLLQEALNRHDGNIAAVMEELSIPRRTLNEKMQKYALVRNSSDAPENE